MSVLLKEKFSLDIQNIALALTTYNIHPHER
jgi:hypothetical protein